MAVKLTDIVLNESNVAIAGVTAKAYSVTSAGVRTLVATDTTTADGVWAFDTGIVGHQVDLADPPAGGWIDVDIENGSQKRRRYGGSKAFLLGVNLAQSMTIGAGQTWDFSAATVLGIPAQVNQLTNPGFEKWSRGPAASYTTNGVYTADRWLMAINGSSTLTVTRETTIVDTGSEASLKAVYVHNASSTIQQSASSSRDWVIPLRGRTLTFKLRVRANAASAVRLQIVDDAGTTSGSYHTGGGAFETLTVTRAVNATTTSLIVRAIFDASVTAYLDNGVLSVGATAPDYVPLHAADEDARCLRYYQRWSDASIQATGAVVNGPAAIGRVVVPLLGAMGGVPTLTYSAVGDWQAGLIGTLTAISIYAAAAGRVSLTITGGSATTSGMATLMERLNANAWFALEYNP